MNVLPSTNAFIQTIYQSIKDIPLTKIVASSFRKLGELSFTTHESLRGRASQLLASAKNHPILSIALLCGTVITVVIIYRLDLILKRRLLKLAADAGYVNAQLYYAVMCYEGKGGEQDFQEARSYYKKAADQGNARDQFQYAFMCYKGEGGPQNLIEAGIYFQKAADQGHLGAQDCLNSLPMTASLPGNG